MNVLGVSDFNHANVKGNSKIQQQELQIQLLNKSYDSFIVSGPSINYSNVTLSSSTYVSGYITSNNASIHGTLKISGILIQFFNLKI